MFWINTDLNVQLKERGVTVDMAELTSKITMQIYRLVTESDFVYTFFMFC